MILATLCYVRHQGKTLMLLRNKKPNDVHEGKWNGLGGKFEAGETPEQCAIRELREESGLNAEMLDLKGVLTFPRFAKGVDWYVFVFNVTQFTGTLHDSPEGHLEWVDDARLLGLELWEGDQIFIPLLTRPGFISGRFTYEHGRLVDHHVEVYPRTDRPQRGELP